MHRYLKVSEVIAELQVNEDFLNSLEVEDLIHLKRTSEGDLVISAEDADRVRLALVLTSELDVNMPGVEIVMHMRESMLAMQRQFSEVLESIVEEVRRQLKR